MSSYTIQLYGLSDATVSHDGIIEEHDDGRQWEPLDSENNTFKLNADATPAKVNISDTDASTGTFDDGSESQLTTSDISVDGTLYPAGAMLQDEYEIDLTDGTNTYRMVAVSERTDSGYEHDTPPIIGFTFEGPAPPDDIPLYYVEGSARDCESMVPCFTPGTLIDVPGGQRPVEALKPGERVLSPDGRAHRILWAGQRRLTAARLAAKPDLKPVRIARGALAPGVPERSLLLSPQHRLLVRSPVVARVSGQREALVAAKHLVGLRGVETATDIATVTYVHLLCSRHVIVTANGAATETLFPGPQALAALARPAREAVRALLPEKAPRPARPLLDGKLGRGLRARHAIRVRPLQWS